MVGSAPPETMLNHNFSTLVLVTIVFPRKVPAIDILPSFTMIDSEYIHACLMGHDFVRWLIYGAIEGKSDAR